MPDSDSELQRLRQENPYHKSSQLVRREHLSGLACVVGISGITLLLEDALVNLLSYFQSVWDFKALSFGPAMMNLWLLYVLGAIGTVLFVVGHRSQASCKLQATAARAAHDRELAERARAQRDAQILEWQQQPFRLLHCQFGWWNEGNQTVIGIHIEYQDFYGGPRHDMYIRLHRVTFEQDPNDEKTVLFHERQSEWDFGQAVTLMLPARPWWLRYQRVATCIPFLPRLR